MDQKIINLYDKFHPRRHEPARIHRPPRRACRLDRGRRGAAAAPAERLCEGAIVPTTIRGSNAEKVTYDSPKGKINGYLVRAKASGKRPAVIVIHENRGLNPHIEDVARRLAVEGYPGVRARPAVGRRRHAAERGRGARPAPKTERTTCWRRRWPRSRSSDARGIDRQGRRGRLLLRRRRGQPDGHRQPRPRGRRCLLRRAAAGRQGAGDQGGAAAAIRRERRQHQQGHRGLRGGAEGQQQEVHASTSIRARSTPSTTTPAPRATTRRPPISPGAARSRSSRSTSARRRRRREATFSARGHREFTCMPTLAARLGGRCSLEDNLVFSVDPVSSSRS